jgi:hypothetical protein
MTDKRPIDAIIVEDSQPDRIRMRLLLDALSLNYKFAWNAEINKVIEIDKIIGMLKKYQPTRLLIDMAWTVEDDRKITKLCFKDKDQIKQMDRKTENGNTKNIISGFELINELVDAYKNNEEYMNNLRKLVIVSKYILPVSYGLKAYIKELVDPMYTVSPSFVTKWSEEQRFRFIMM